MLKRLIKLPFVLLGLTLKLLVLIVLYLIKPLGWLLGWLLYCLVKGTEPDDIFAPYDDLCDWIEDIEFTNWWLK